MPSKRILICDDLSFFSMIANERASLLDREASDLFSTVTSYYRLSDHDSIFTSNKNRNEKDVDWERLSDPLSRHVVYNPKYKRTDFKSEFKYFCAIVEKLSLSDMYTFQGLLSTIDKIQNIVCSGVAGFRKINVSTTADRKGNVLVYPPPAVSRRMIIESVNFLLSNVLTHSSIVCFCSALIKAHPFVDGNGRTCRVLYNLLMSIMVGNINFVPLQQIAMLDYKSFLVKTRRMMFHSNIIPLIEWHVEAINLYNTISESQRRKIYE